LASWPPWIHSLGSRADLGDSKVLKLPQLRVKNLAGKYALDKYLKIYYKLPWIHGYMDSLLEILELGGFF
jgi:hypothetical protein